MITIIEGVGKVLEKRLGVGAGVDSVGKVLAWHAQSPGLASSTTSTEHAGECLAEGIGDQKSKVTLQCIGNFSLSYMKQESSKTKLKTRKWEWGAMGILGKQVHK